MEQGNKKKNSVTTDTKGRFKVDQSIIGKTFGKLTVQGVHEVKDHVTYLKCLCDCGGTKITRRATVINGLIASCGCIARGKGKQELYNLKGRIFGKLTVVDLHSTENGIIFNAICECGKAVLVSSHKLKTKRATSCGCGKTRRHGGSKESLYSVFANMKQRCYQTNTKEYKYYGERGISVCLEWMDYANFRIWSNEYGYKKGLSLDRIDVNGNYEPSNCRWITQKDQCRNKRNNINITINNSTKCLSDWIDFFLLNKHEQTIRTRISRGWDPFKALITPPSKIHSSKKEVISV